MKHMFLKNYCLLVLLTPLPASSYPNVYNAKHDAISLVRMYLTLMYSII